MENNFESRETIERKFKNFLKIASTLIIFFSIISLYQNEKWKYHKEVIKEEIPNSHDKLLYVIEYKYFSFKKMRWLYRISTPTTHPVKYYEWDKNENTLNPIDKNEY